MTLPQKSTNENLKQVAQNSQPLDLYSIRHTNLDLGAYAIPQKQEAKCLYNAPFYAWQSTEYGWNVAQGNCHHWDCPKCGINRAKHEWWRIVNGTRELAEEHELYFITLTCKGREISVSDADENYYKWTTLLLNACRNRAKRAGKDWTYVQITERQKRGHPHSHMISTWKPDDLEMGTRIDWKTVNGQRVGEVVDTLRSEWFAKRLDSAGLGSQYDIGKVRDNDGAAKYAAKYLFKAENLLQEWPKNWRRVRYSNSFPKLQKTQTNAIVLITDEHLHELAKQATVLKPQDYASNWFCSLVQGRHDVLVKEFKAEKDNDTTIF